MCRICDELLWSAMRANMMQGQQRYLEKDWGAALNFAKSVQEAARLSETRLVALLLTGDVSQKDAPHHRERIQELSGMAEALETLCVYQLAAEQAALAGMAGARASRHRDDRSVS